MTTMTILKHKQVKELQHMIKNHMQAYFKNNLGKASEQMQILIVRDLLVIKLEGYLTEIEKYICNSPEGIKFVRAERTNLIKQVVEENIAYLEELVGAKAVHHAIGVEPGSNFGLYVIVFDRNLTEE